MKVVIIKYNAGNIQSVLFALQRLGIEGSVSDAPSVISTADKVLFPGVGEASSAMNYLKERNLDALICSLKQPVLGICLGMQLLCKHSEEGNTNCLGIFDNNIKRFTSSNLKVPQIGWNTIFNTKGKLFQGLSASTHQYFVHGYYAESSNNDIASTEYGIRYASALQKNNFYGVQFHPEKSSDAGQRILENFLNL
jgi:imidazole glycerol-phosphate synthase subunit HisH